ncbi:hypothetical protein PHAMO_210092 [Magnetospirillum molischianum DSM 120]|uniref:Uncharacterized protein n=1 Tax=Magnetospirillum molischianum DSM 120 TaxID=1150626 RepID=H8FQE3_MAGML|nr:hypothetical protein PHAMO_210092 [Magnetospirillum molischianum DSM 120]
MSAASDRPARGRAGSSRKSCADQAQTVPLVDKPLCLATQVMFVDLWAKTWSSFSLNL